MEPEGSITYELLREITDNFSEEQLLGQGAFGRVYRGVMKSGEEVAVKLLASVDPGLDDKLFNHEFCNLIRLKHPNTVKFLGYCYDTRTELVEFHGNLVTGEWTHRALCFEYLHNGSLDKYICDESSGLDWNIRYSIIRGICEGLKYLHQGEIPTFHLDLKPGNILLDTNMVPKLADFGLSRIFREKFPRITHNHYGTSGYIPPEYINQGLISEKFDIFSLGVVMLKIVSGPRGYTKRAEIPPQEFIAHVQEQWRERLETTFSGSLLEAYCIQIKTCTEIALTSTHYDPDMRPRIHDIMDKLIKSEPLMPNLKMDPQGKVCKAKTSMQIFFSALFHSSATISFCNRTLRCYSNYMICR
ncbi:hypothetical protein PR202_ga12032 [Eleusine coracana subsp. coracana]|uniref:non-specific serine/threonine protein kinase n=1 Tax=Eleusine coracana subsp. coracana TaxID=191504 RepID=A0AAV5CB41_ELECO|nr:hypothetical protein PR202_ga12032 [Eleusine coracana subsp. coracana]